MYITVSRVEHWMMTAAMDFSMWSYHLNKHHVIDNRHGMPTRRMEQPVMWSYQHHVVNNQHGTPTRRT